MSGLKMIALVAQKLMRAPDTGSMIGSSNQSKQYCMYLRKSRADLDSESRDEGDILARHERHLMAVAHKMGIHIPESAIYREVVSGETIDDRPVVQELIQDVEDGKWAGVFVMEVERLARGDTSDQGLIASTFKYSSTKIITPNKTYDPNDEFDEEYFEFGLFMSRREYKTINRRQQRGRKDAVKEGKFPGNKAPYGYVRKKLEKEKGYTLEPHPDQAPIVKLIFDMYVNQNVGSGMIANYLKKTGVPTALGSVWEVQTVTSILKNPIYYGLVTWGRRSQVKARHKGVTIKSRPRTPRDKWVVGEGRHEPLVTKEMWDRAQEIMASHRNHTGPRGVIASSLAGIVKCKLCGKAMVRRTYTRNQAPTLICTTRGCNNISSSYELVEARIIDGLRDWIEEYKAQWGESAQSHKNRMNDKMLLAAKESVMRSAEKNVDRLNVQADNLDDLLEQGVYTKEKYIERANRLRGRIEEAEAAYAEAKKEYELELQRQQAKIDIIPKVEHVLDVYPCTDDVELKNELLKSVIEVCTYIKTVRGHWSKPDTLEQFEVTIYPKLPKHSHQNPKRLGI
ncbi:recombinase family protein [Paenibacillus sp. 3LSP]|uniref:recombinase family protein n=1 Tax=Paenibacillus sp. 3LSP TaxID=2800795 RepID=UPI0028FD88D9|nr:recombinase family protein [Paenibacillus sp. 3LSP]MDU0332574.1 recombinase family protein [Paenibacillus sp. 3LSP]